MRFQPIWAIWTANGAPTVKRRLIYSEAAWCYLNGVGTKKDVKKAARYYRMTENQGMKHVGLSWIWKDKYNENQEPQTRRGSGHVNETSLHGTSKKGKNLFGRKESA